MYSTNQEAFDDWLKGTIVYEQFADETRQGELQNIEERLENPDEIEDYDEDRVYISDIKKVFQWYNALHSAELIKLPVEKEKKEYE